MIPRWGQFSFAVVSDVPESSGLPPGLLSPLLRVIPGFLKDFWLCLSCFPKSLSSKTYKNRCSVLGLAMSMYSLLMEQYLFMYVSPGASECPHNIGKHLCFMQPFISTSEAWAEN